MTTIGGGGCMMGTIRHPWNIAVIVCCCVYCILYVNFTNTTYLSISSAIYGGVDVNGGASPEGGARGSVWKMEDLLATPKLQKKSDCPKSSSDSSPTAVVAPPSYCSNDTTQSSPSSSSDECLIPRILQSRAMAEKMWKEEHAYLWMMHARKAGGTTLCMQMRQNTMGLVRTNPKPDLKRETCQITSLCVDCDLKNQLWYTEEGLANHTKNYMNRVGRNFIEIEGSGAPANLLQDMDGGWHDVVFITTLRHPIDRIVSLLLNDVPCSRDQQCFENKKASFVQDQSKCSKSVYFCHSNYFVRIFSGRDQHYTNDDDMLARAKLNFWRFSCVVLVEHWDETSNCLHDKLGLFLRDRRKFNIAGSMVNNQLVNHSTTAKDDSESPTTHRRHQNKHLTPEEYDMMAAANMVDLEFYYWVKEQLGFGPPSAFDDYTHTKDLQVSSTVDTPL